MKRAKRRRPIKRIAVLSFGVMAALALSFMLNQFRSIVLLFILAILFSAAIRPPIQLLINKFNIARPTATISIYLLAALVFLGFIIIPSTELVDESQTILNDIAATYESRYPTWKEGSTFEQTIAAELPPPDKLYETLIGPLIGQEILSLTQGLFTILTAIAAIFILSVYWTIDQTQLERYWLSLLPADQRVKARQFWRATEAGIGAYFRSEIIQSFIAALSLAVIYWLLGIPFPLILAGLAAIAWLIPLVGAIFAILPLIAIGLLYGSFPLVIIAALCTIVILSGLEFIIEPRLFNRRRYNATVTVLLMLIFVEGFGFIGLIMAPPIAAALQIFFNYWVKNISNSPPETTSSELTSLHQRYDALLAHQESTGESFSPALENLSKRLALLIDKAEKL